MELKTISLFVLSALVLPVHAFAFHSITEILPSNKILVCKDYNQTRNGQTVEVFSRKIKTTDFNRNIEKIDEYTLPDVGQKIELNFVEFKGSDKTHKEFHSEKIGTATVIEPKLAGEVRNWIDLRDKRVSNPTVKNKIISVEEENAIAKNCLVAQIDNDVDLKKVKSVSY